MSRKLTITANTCIVKSLSVQISNQPDINHLKNYGDSVFKGNVNNPANRYDAHRVLDGKFQPRHHKSKTGLLNFATELGNISKSCRIMAFFRDTFLYQVARISGGVEVLFEVSTKNQI